MAEENENEVQGQDEGTEYVPESGTDISSSPESDLYAPYLEKFPTSLHGIARDVFKEWDGNVTKRIQSVHSEYDPYKPVIESYEPDALQTAVSIAEALDSDPRAFYEALAEAYGFTPEQGQQFAAEQLQEEQPASVDEFDPLNQRLSQQEQLLRTMAETMLAERQANEQAQREQYEDQLYADTMNHLTEKFGEFDVDYVNALLAQGYDPEQAVTQWQQAVGEYASKQLAPNSNAPIVMGAGGGTPSIQRDVSELSSQETRRLVEDMLRQSAESGR